MHDFEALLAKLDDEDAMELLLATGQRATVRYRDGRSVSLTTRPLTPGELRDVIAGSPLTAIVRRATPDGVEDTLHLGDHAYRVHAVRAGVAVALRLARGRPAPRGRGVVLPTPAPMRAATAPPRTPPSHDRAQRRAGDGLPESARVTQQPRPSPAPAHAPPNLRFGESTPTHPRRGSVAPPHTPRPASPPRAPESGPYMGQPAQGQVPSTSSLAAARQAPASVAPAPPTLTRAQGAPPAAAAPAEEIPAALVALVEGAREVDASDLYVLPGAPPQARTAEGLSPLGSPVPSGTLAGFGEALASASPPSRAYPGDQVRVTALPGVDGVALHVRLYPRHRPTLEDLGLADIAARLGDVRRGLILVGSRRGHGRGMTREALVEHIARTYGRSAVSLAPTASPYAGGLARWWGDVSPDEALALAEAQAVEVLGFPDLTSGAWVLAAQRAVESGRVVVATVAARPGGEVLTRALDCAEERAAFAGFLAGELRLAVSQELFAATAGGGRVAVFETLWGGPRLWSALQRAAGDRGDLDLEVLLTRRAGSDSRSLSAAAAELATLGRIHERDAAQAAARCAPALSPLETHAQTAESPTASTKPGGASGRGGGLGGRLSSLFRAKDGRAGAKGAGKTEGER